MGANNNQNNDNNQVSSYMPVTAEKIDNMTKIIQDDAKTKTDILGELADAKLNMYKEDEEVRRTITELEVTLAATKQELHKANRDNINLVDRIKSQQDVPNIGVQQAEQKAQQAEQDLEREKRMKEYDLLIDQEFSTQSADAYMKAKYGADWNK